MAKKEIYARVAVQLRTNTRAIKAEKKCPGAMGLYLFLLLDARGEETHGEVDEDVALTSWGAPGPYRRKQADALIELGLAENRDGKLVVLRYEDHNDTPKQIAEARKAAADRKQKQRGSHGSHAVHARDTGGGHAGVTRDIGVTEPESHAGVLRESRDGHAEVPCSSSCSISETGSRSDPPARSGGPPDWWDGAVGAAAMAVGDVSDPNARWLEYFASRDRKGWTPSHTDAVGWLTAVVRSERTRRVHAGDDRSSVGHAGAAPAPRRDLTNYQP